MDLSNILNNIVREVDAIRGYMLDPVEDNKEFILDEIGHIVKLAGQLSEAVCDKAEVVAEKLEEISEELEAIEPEAEDEGKVLVAKILAE